MFSEFGALGEIASPTGGYIFCSFIGFTSDIA
jgi:hypothetical protein